MEGKTVIEVNGVKLEVDLRTARRIEEIRVGDRVKVLEKQYDGYKVRPGSVVGFEPFNNLPTIIVAVLCSEWNSIGVKFLYFNSQSTDVEIVKAIDDDQLELNKADILSQFDREIAKKDEELIDLKRRRQFFVDNFRAYWADMEKVNAQQTT